MNPWYIPKPVLEAFRHSQPRYSVEAAALSADLAGFNAMCEALLTLGREGEETLARELEFLFAPLVSLVESHGGFVADYAGDALIAAFPPREGTSLAQSVYLARQCAEEYLLWLGQNARRVTPAGEFTLGIRLGIATGHLECPILRGDDESESVTCYYHGSAVERCTKAQSSAAVGSVAVYEGTPDAEPIQAAAPNSVKSLTDHELKVFLPESLVGFHPRGEARRVASLYGRIGFRASRARLEKLMRVLNRGVRLFGGYLSGLHYDANGWGFLVIFGAPQSHEDNLRRALEAALFIRREVTAQGNPRLRMGLNAGEVYAGLTGGAGRVKYTCLGDAVNQSERISRLAEPGEILCAEAVKNGTSAFEFDNVGRHQVKGRRASIRVFTLLGRKYALPGMAYDGPMVGRQKELAQVLQRIEPIFSGQPAGWIRLIGDAGCGKTRLAWEVCQSLTSQGRDFTWIHLVCDPIKKEPFNPLLTFLKSRFPYAEYGRDASWAERFSQAFRDWADDPRLSERRRTALMRTVSILGGQLGYRYPDSIWELLDAYDRNEQFMEGMKAFVEAEAEMAPVVLVLEDAQWLDEETEEWLQLLTSATHQVPLSILSTERPHEDGQARAWTLEADMLTLTVNLGNLATEPSLELAIAELTVPPDAKLTEYLMGLSEGNPFFLEQICRHLLEQGLISVQDNRAVLIAAPQNLPPTAESILVARLDALQPKVRSLVQRAAILGQRFALRILEGMMQSQPDFDSLVQKAQDEQVIEPEDRAELTRLSYLFRHALLREAAYGMQLPESRRELHRLALSLYERVYAPEERGSVWLDMIQHAEASGERDKLVEYVTAGAHYFEEKYLLPLSLTLFNRLYDLARSPKEKGDALIGRCCIHEKLGRYAEAIPGCEEAIRLAEETGDDLAQADALSMLATIHRRQGDRVQAESLHGRVMAIRERVLGPGHPDVADALNNLACVYMDKGRFLEAEPLLLRALRIHEQSFGLEHLDVANSLNNLAYAENELGRYVEAEEHHKRALAIREKALGPNHPWVANSLNNLASIYSNQGRYAEMEPLYLRVQTIREKVLGPEHPDVALALNNRAFIHHNQGTWFKAVPLHLRALAIWEKALGPDHPDVALSLGNLAIAYNQLGRYAEAEQMHLRALAIREKTRGPKHPDVARSLNGLAMGYIAQGRFTEAIPLLERAIVIFEGSLGREHLLTAMVVLGLGGARRELGELDASEALIQQALASLESAVGKANHRYGSGLVELGKLRLAQHRLPDAIATFKAARTVLEDALGPGHPEVVKVLNVLADCTTGKGRT